MGFAASSGWLTNVKKRNGLVAHRISGESAEVDEVELKVWRELELYPAMMEFSPDDIFNADETGLFFQALPDTTLDFSSKSQFKWHSPGRGGSRGSLGERSTEERMSN